MGILPTPSNSNDWAVKKGVIVKCQICQTYYDPHVGHDCPKKKPSKKDIFKNVVWLK